MSQENVELFRKAVDAYTRGDVEAFLETAHPEVEWHPFTAKAEGGEAYRGHEGVRRWWTNLESSLDHFEATALECRDLGETVIAFGQLRLRFKSGVTLDQEIAWVIRYEDGLFVWGCTYPDRVEALEAVELSE